MYRWYHLKIWALVIFVLRLRSFCGRQTRVCLFMTFSHNSVLTVWCNTSSRTQCLKQFSLSSARLIGLSTRLCWEKKGKYGFFVVVIFCSGCQNDCAASLNLALKNGLWDYNNSGKIEVPDSKNLRYGFLNCKNIYNFSVMQITTAAQDIRIIHCIIITYSLTNFTHKTKRYFDHVRTWK